MTATSCVVKYRGRWVRVTATIATLLATLIAVSSCSSSGIPDDIDRSPNKNYRYTPRPSGLLWDSGVFGHDPKITGAFEKMRGHKLDVLGVSPTRGSWEEHLSDWWLTEKTIPAGFSGTLNISVQLFPKDGTLEKAAQGAYNEDFKRLGALIATKYPNAYVRPGWEFNIVNWPWKATPSNVGTFKTAFRQASTSLKSGGPDLRIVWNPNEGRGNSLPDATTAWPGDDVVDIVGIDAYDWSPPYDQKGWKEHRTRPQGWDYWGTFARTHGKKFALPEWGVIRGSEESGGDNPQYIHYAYGWMYANRDIMAFDTYFEEPDDYCKCALSINPEAQRAYMAWMPQLTYHAPGSATAATAALPAALSPRREFL
ncbi:Beta-mannanase [Dermatophilus congolensis]|uniref:Beta-mannanase n=1 Tax=Dermatophilus congolensis TaxID=1863 RepID=A0AA46H1H6_9MICO|nr:Beta-mannanase [Dermatophilus congolensis]